MDNGLRFIDDMLSLVDEKKITELVDVPVLKTYLNKYYDCVRDFLEEEKKSSFSLPKDVCEFWVKKSIKSSSAKIIGHGNKPFDIQTDTFVCDIKAITANNRRVSNEVSLMQDFHTVGKDLDTTFNDENIISIWSDKLLEKYNSTERRSTEQKPIYFMFLITLNRVEVYICVMKVNPNFLLRESRRTKKSIRVLGCIYERYGLCQLYLSKKRLELRLNVRNIISDGYCIRVM
jgi:hypothetical protein